MKLPHSPLPWAEDEHAVVAANGRQVFFFDDRSPQGRADRAHIIASVNRHAELVEALRKCIEALEVCEESAKYGDGFPMIAHDAMDKAKALTEPVTE